MSRHLSYGQGDPQPEGQSNLRNGTSGKTVLTDEGPLHIEVPRDRDGSYQPQIIGKHERRFTGFDQKIIAMYARGMTVREIQGYLAEMYGTEVLVEAIETAFLSTSVQTCIVHLIRNSLDYGSWKERKAVAATLPIYTAATAEAAREALEDFAALSLAGA